MPVCWWISWASIRNEKIEAVVVWKTRFKTSTFLTIGLVNIKITDFTYFDHIHSVLVFLDPYPPIWVWLSSLNMILSCSIFFFFYKLQPSTLSYDWITYNSLQNKLRLPEQNYHKVLLFHAWEPRSAHRRERYTHDHCGTTQNWQVAGTGRLAPQQMSKTCFPAAPSAPEAASQQPVGWTYVFVKCRVPARLHIVISSYLFPYQDRILFQCGILPSLNLSASSPRRWREKQLSSSLTRSRGCLEILCLCFMSFGS